MRRIPPRFGSQALDSFYAKDLPDGIGHMLDFPSKGFPKASSFNGHCVHASPSLQFRMPQAKVNGAAIINGLVTIVTAVKTNFCIASSPFSFFRVFTLRTLEHHQLARAGALLDVAHAPGKMKPLCCVKHLPSKKLAISAVLSGCS